MTKFRDALSLLSKSRESLSRREFSSNLGSLNLGWDNEEYEPGDNAEYFENLIIEVRRAILDGRQIKQSRKLKHLAQILWDPVFKLGADEKLTLYYIDCLDACPFRSPLRALSRQYLFHWPHSERHEGHLGNYIREKSALSTVGWLYTAAQNRLFHGEAVIIRLANEIIDSNDTPDLILDRTGLRGGLSAGAYAEEIFHKACDIVKAAPELSSYKRLQKFLVEKIGVEFVFRFTSGAAKNSFASALLAPWNRATPPSETQRWIIKSLLEAFDDPRLSVGKWQGVDDAHIKILKRWLAQESLEQFLNIVDQSITDFDKRRMWSYRRPFWTSYFEAGLIHEAWVLFGRDATRLAKLAARKDPTFNNSYGFLDSADKSHSVLLMKIGDITIAEWSHNGRCWIWRSPRGAPRLYQREMTDYACRGASFGQVHGGAPNFNWQFAVATELGRLGVPRPPSSQWRP